MRLTTSLWGRLYRVLICTIGGNLHRWQVHVSVHLSGGSPGGNSFTDTVEYLLTKACSRSSGDLPGPRDQAGMQHTLAKRYAGWPGYQQQGCLLPGEG